jgi:hypothetical protein
VPRSVDIFAESEVSLEDFVQDIEKLLGIKLQRISEGEEIFYEFRDPHVVFTVGTHDLANDRDMNFEDYRYHLSARALNISTEEERKKWRDEFARVIFQKLKTTQNYHLILVEDTQVKVAEFHPEADIVR